MGREVVVANTEGRLDFGTWEQIFYSVIDVRRRKRVPGKNNWRIRSSQFNVKVLALTTVIHMNTLFYLNGIATLWYT